MVAITYYTAFGSPGRMARDLFRWLYMKLGLNRLLAPGDFTWASLRDRLRGRARQREKEQAWERRRSAQIAKENQERRQGRMNHGNTAGTPSGGGGGGGVLRHATNTSLFGGGGGGSGNNNNHNNNNGTDSALPTPATPAHTLVQNQQTGMLGIYQDMNTIAGTRRTARTPDTMV